MGKYLIVNPRAGKSKPYATIGDSECLGLLNFIKLCGHSVDYLKPARLNDDRCISLEDIKDVNAYDNIFLYNFTPNFYGGAEDSFLVNCYKLCAKFTKPIYYLLVDMGIFFSQLNEKLLNNGWESLKGCSKDDITIKNITYISQGYDIEKVKSIALKKDPTVNGVIYFPLQFMSIFNDNKINLLPPSKSSDVLNRPYDLYYGGSYRSGKRDKQFREYFFNRDLKVGFFGTISKNKFEGKFESEPDFNGKVDQNSIIEENKKGFATIVLSEKDYNDNIITLRVFESLLAGMVVFIDKNLDTNKKIFANDFLDILYVSSGKQLEERIKFLKSTPKVLSTVLALQNKEFSRHFNLNVLIDMFNKEVLNV